MWVSFTFIYTVDVLAFVLEIKTVFLCCLATEWGSNSSEEALHQSGDGQSVDGEESVQGAADGAPGSCEVDGDDQVTKITACAFNCGSVDVSQHNSHNVFPCRASRENPALTEKKKSSIWQLWVLLNVLHCILSSWLYSENQVFLQANFSLNP